MRDATYPEAVTRPRREVWRTLWGYVSHYRGRVAVVVVLLVIAKLATVAVPFALKLIVDRLGAPDPVAIVPVFLLVGYALLRFAGTLFGELRDLVFSRVSHGAMADFHARAFEHLLHLNPRFHNQRQTGRLVRDVERGIAGIGFLLGVGLFTIVPTLVEIAAVVGILAARYSVWFTAIIVGTFVAYTTFTVIFTQKREVHQRNLNELDSRASGRLVDNLLNYDTVKAHANEPYEATRYRSVLGDWVLVALRNQRSLFKLHIGQSGVIAVGVSLVMLLAGREVVAGSMTVGDLVLVNAYVIQICLPLNALGFVFRQARDAVVNAERLFELLREKAEIEDVPGAPPLKVDRAEVAFENIDFAYDPGRPILRNIDFRIPPGGTIAIVGGSGSGKSTLSRLLLRLYDPTAGAVRIDGQDIREVSQESLRRAVGIVPQDTILFNDTIAHNIGYGRTGASREEIIEAAKAAHIHDLIAALPEQYDTVVGERGLKLSGGEKQRIAIARVLLKNPQILIFDEATSALDARAERAIQAELDRLAESRTTLTIAHRLSTIVGADEILVLEHGQIVERGTHADLLATGGIYSQMWSLQQRQQELARAERRVALRPVDLREVAGAVVDGLKARLDDRHVNLRAVLGGPSAQVTADPLQLQQVVWDLCAGAIESSPPGGHVAVDVSRVGGNARLQVTDAQAKVSALELPLRATAEEAPAPGAPRPTLEGLCALVVDDQEEARFLLETILKGHGARVRTAANAADAIGMLKSARHDEWPDVLVCDIALPDEDGYSLMQRIRALEEEQDASGRLPAIALTGYAGSEERTRAIRAGFQLHFAKPVEPSRLIAALDALAAPRARRGASTPA